MRIHSLHHVPFEDIGSLLQDVEAQGHRLTCTHWYRGDTAPEIDTFDVLIVMGGPMGVYDDATLPWLSNEKKFLAQAISANKKILGICLGAQLIACVLGAKVSKNPHKEIGWFPLQIPAKTSNHPIAKILADCPQVFHWHGDTFALPNGAQLLASSEACTNQAYVIGQNIVGFQFHLETTEASAAALIKNCGEDLDKSAFVQSAESMLQNKENFAAINQAMSKIWAEILT